MFSYLTACVATGKWDAESRATMITLKQINRNEGKEIINKKLEESDRKPIEDYTYER